MIVSEWFQDYLSLIDDEAGKKGKRFYINIPEGHYMSWPERELELWDVSGWMVDAGEIMDFERCYYGYFENDHQISAEFQERYADQLQMVEWEIDESGKIYLNIHPK